MRMKMNNDKETRDTIFDAQPDIAGKADEY